MADSSFFGGVHNGIRTPETVMNSGPLPPLETGGLPYGLNGVPDAKINYNSSLLGDLDPYAYGGPSRLSTQSSYINIPNRIQKVVPKLQLPGTSDAEPYFALSHAVDDGDLCFAFRDRFFKSVPDRQALDKMYTQYNYHPFINLATVNYLLAGMQTWHSYDLGLRHNNDNRECNPLPSTWEMLVRTCFQNQEPHVVIAQQVETDKTWVTKQNLETATRAVCSMFLPFGIAHGSERQGGGHEGTLNPVTWATNFVTTMYVDGHVRNLGNLWRGHDILAGDRLILTLKNVPFPREYVLNHYHKAMVRKVFPTSRRFDHVYQLVPEVETSSHAPFDLASWHIAMAYSRSAAYMKGEDTTFHYDSTLLRGALLEASFQPNLITSGTEAANDTNLRLQGKPKEQPDAKKPKTESAGANFTKFALALSGTAPAAPRATLGAAAAAPAVDSSAVVDAPPAPPEPAPAPSGKRSQKKKVQASVLGADAGAGGVTLGDVI